MSNDYGCETCGYARATVGDEVFFGTHYCKLNKEFVECKPFCDQWEGLKDETDYKGLKSN